MDIAEDHRIKGNALFKRGDYLNAKKEYEQSVLLNPKNGVVFSNLALVAIKLENFGEAISLASRSIDLSCLKGYYRRGCAHLSLGNISKALADFKTISIYFPSDKSVNSKLKFCNIEWRKLAFLKAIQPKDILPISKKIEIDKMVVENSYKGLLVDFPLCLESVKKIKNEFFDTKLIHRRYAFQIVLEALAIFKKEKTLIRSEIRPGTKFTVCGDIHGQYYDLLNIFEMNGLPSEENIYLFNGDFVDRGSFSVECILLLYCFKIIYPTSFFLNRGNHEADSMNKIFGFKNEVLYKYEEDLYELFLESFQMIPLAHQLGDKALILHGGLFRDQNVTIEDIANIDRFREPPDNGLMCDLLWSDPGENYGINPSKRGVGINFGPDVLEAFLNRNSVELLIRSHEAKQEGCEVTCGGRLITVFSAPNYCDMMNNKGAFIKFSDDYSYEIIIFSHVKHPNVKAMKYAVNAM